jgi:hypothetical protein
VAAALVALAAAASPSSASCTAPSLSRHERLTLIKAGEGPGDVAFVGRLLRKDPVLELNGDPATPYVFAVDRIFKGAATATQVVLIPEGCLRGMCKVGLSESAHYGTGPQLVFAEADGTRRLLDASSCSDAGPLTAADAAFLLQPAGQPQSEARPAATSGTTVRQTAAALALVALALGLLAVAARARWAGRTGP